MSPVDLMSDRFPTQPTQPLSVGSKSSATDRSSATVSHEGLGRQIEVETMKRQRRSAKARTVTERLQIAERLQQEAYALMQANPKAWESFVRRNYRKRRVDAQAMTSGAPKSP